MTVAGNICQALCIGRRIVRDVQRHRFHSLERVRDAGRRLRRRGPRVRERVGAWQGSSLVHSSTLRHGVSTRAKPGASL
jgi:hypothetical protein